MEINEKLKLLAGSIQMHDESLAEATGSHAVLLSAVLALVRTHPEPNRFAEEFRRAWLLLGAPNQAAEPGSLYADHVDELLDMIEEALHAPLAVRPPRD